MRKRTIWFLVSMMVLLGCGVSLVAGGGATVINDLACGMRDASGNTVVTDSSHAVITPNGNTTLTCQINLTGTGAQVEFDYSNTGTPCGTFAGDTTDWQEIISASGQATLTCHINGS